MIEIDSGYRPYPWQSVVHKAITEAGPKAGKIFVVKSPRQIGKSMIVMMELLRHAIDYAGSISICVSLTFSNVSKIFKEILDGIKESGIVESTNGSGMVINFINGSKIYFKAASQRDSLRGYTIKRGGLLCLDECAFMGEDIFALTFPWTQVANANILMTSTPFLKQGTYYNYFQAGLSGTNPTIQSFDLCQYDTSRMLSAERIETYRKLMPKNQFRAEILGEFIEDGGGVFETSLNVWQDKVYSTNQIIIDSDEPLFLGLDWGTGQNSDYTALTGFTSTGEQQVLFYINSESPTQQITRIVNIIEKINPKRIKSLVVETNSIGRVYIDLLKTQLRNIQITEFTTTNESKREIIEYLISRFNSADLKLFNHKELYNEFSAYFMEISKTGKITYNGHSQHDDLVMSTAFAFKGIKNLESSNYNLSFGTKHSNKNIRSRYR